MAQISWERNHQPCVASLNEVLLCVEEVTQLESWLRPYSRRTKSVRIVLHLPTAAEDAPPYSFGEALCPYVCNKVLFTRSDT